MGNAWDRRADEGAKEFAAFSVYRDMGSTRTVDKAYLYANPSAKSDRGSATWYRYSSDFQWVTRGNLFDEYCANIRQGAVVEYEKSQGASIAKERVRHKREEVICSTLGFARAREILEMDMVWDELKVITSKDGSETKIITKKYIPPPLLFAAVGLLQASSKIGRQSLGIEDNEGSAVSQEEWRELFYSSRIAMQKQMPRGAMQNPPAQPSAKPVLNLAGNGDAASDHAIMKPPRERPGQ